jgi:DNA (cytosine-5)-methyltransferase 1
MMMRVPVIDLFAGPGGLGEGFSARRGALNFDVVLSIEKDPAACKTLELRHFFRQFGKDQVPDLYYAYVRGEGVTRDELFRAFPENACLASAATWHAELGKEPLPNVLRRIRKAVGNSRHWVLLGGPPCQAYSIIGRVRMKGFEGFGTDQRHTLYREYLKIVAAFQPTVFVMENVKGILSSRHRDEKIFTRILQDMQDPWNTLSEDDRKEMPKPGVSHRYRLWSFSKTALRHDLLGPNDYVIESEHYGIPQTRHRVIILGIREDYDIVPPVLEKAGGRFTVRDVIYGMPPIRSRLSRGEQDTPSWVRAIQGQMNQWHQESVGDPEVAARITEILDTLPQSFEPGGRFVSGSAAPDRLSGWLFDERLGGVLQHESRAHMPSDLHRYLYAACYAEIYETFPRIDDFPAWLWPKHSNASLGTKVEDFRDRFRVQLWDGPATTITSHICKDGHYFIHPDSTQCRSLTVREAARLQTFPDNYFFEGYRTDQYWQIGNAVPPLLALQLADIVAEVLEACMDQDIGRSPLANVTYVTR